MVLSWREQRGIPVSASRMCAGQKGTTASFTCQILRYVRIGHVLVNNQYDVIRIQSQEKIDLLKMLGADVRPVPAVAYENPKNYNHQAKEFAEATPGAVWTNQFDNVANARAHYETTGPEIWRQTNGQVSHHHAVVDRLNPERLQIDAFICSTGTGGTLAGVARYFRELHEKGEKKVDSWLADPPGSVLYSYITSGGKLKEREGGSITEGKFQP